MIEPRTLAELWRTYGDRLVLIARSLGEPAEDAVQEAFVALACQNELPDDPLAWLARASRNAMLQTWRSRKRRERREQASADSRDWFVQDHQRLDERLDASVVTQRLQQLPEEQREVIVMHLWGEMTFRQIADVIGLSPSQAHRHYQNGLKQIQRVVRPASEPDTVSK